MTNYSTLTENFIENQSLLKHYSPRLQICHVKLKHTFIDLSSNSLDSSQAQVIHYFGHLSHLSILYLLPIHFPICAQSNYKIISMTLWLPVLINVYLALNTFRPHKGSHKFLGDRCFSETSSSFSFLILFTVETTHLKKY